MHALSTIFLDEFIEVKITPGLLRKGGVCQFLCPVSVEVFEGNTADPTTVSNQIEKLQKRFGLKRVVIVGDRGMLTEARIQEEFKGKDGLDWISALKAPAIKKLAEEKTIQPSLFDEVDLAEISSPEFPDERLIVCRDPLLMEKRRRKRNELLFETEKKLDQIGLGPKFGQRDTDFIRISRSFLRCLRGML